jgi:hypothetical protein
MAGHGLRGRRPTELERAIEEAEDIKDNMRRQERLETAIAILTRAAMKDGVITHDEACMILEVVETLVAINETQRRVVRVRAEDPIFGWSDHIPIGQRRAAAVTLNSVITPERVV